MIKKICNVILFLLIVFIITTILARSYYRRCCPYCGETLQFVPSRTLTVDCNKFIYNGSNCPYCKCKLQYKDIEKKWIWEDYND